MVVKCIFMPLNLPKKAIFQKKMHFFAKIFGHVHFLLYLCTRFRMRAMFLNILRQ
jgi:hypothetical protein